MKKFFFILTLFVLICPLTSSATIEIKETFNQGETLIAKILGNFPSSLEKGHISFYREHVRIPLSFSLAKIEGEYYLYASLLGKNPGNYSINITDLQYVQGGITTRGDISKEFSISNESAVFSINPGFVITSEDFFVEVQSLTDEKITLSIDLGTEDKDIRELYFEIDGEETLAGEIEFFSSEKKRVPLTLKEGESGVWTITLSSGETTYSIPVSVFGEKTPVLKSSAFSIEPQNIVYFLPTKSKNKETIYIYNTGDTSLENISLSVSASLEGIVSFSENNIEELDPDSFYPIELTVFYDKEEEINGKIQAQTESMISISTVSISFEKNYVEPVVEKNSSLSSSLRTCEELKGKVCDYVNQTCTGDLVSAADDLCCLDECENKPNPKNKNKLLGFGILLLILIIFVVFYKKYKSAKKPLNLLEIAKGKKKPVEKKY